MVLFKGIVFALFSSTVLYPTLVQSTPTPTPIPIPQAPAKVGGIFSQIPSPLAGNCNQYDVDTQFSDAKTLTQNAIDAINKLLAGGLKRGDLTLVHTASSLWGIKYYQVPVVKNIFITKGKDTLNTALTTFQPGYSWSSYYRLMIPDWAYDSNGSPGGSICNGYNKKGEQSSTKAITWYQAQLIMMCNSAFQFGGATLASRIAGQAGLASGTTLDEQQFPGAVFQHEMMHFIGKGIIDVSVTLPEGIFAAYGFNLCAGVANREEYAGQALINADNYRNFAVAVSLSAIDWSEGAKP